MRKGSGCILCAKGSQSQPDIPQASLRWFNRRESLQGEGNSVFSLSVWFKHWNKQMEGKLGSVRMFMSHPEPFGGSVAFFLCFLCPVLHQLCAFPGCCLRLNWARLIRYISKKTIWQKSGQFSLRSMSWTGSQWMWGQKVLQGQRDVGREEQGEKGWTQAPTFSVRTIFYIGPTVSWNFTLMPSWNSAEISGWGQWCKGHIWPCTFYCKLKESYDLLFLQVILV